MNRTSKLSGFLIPGVCLATTLLLAPVQRVASEASTNQSPDVLHLDSGASSETADERWSIVKSSLFGDKTIEEDADENVLTLDIAERAQDAAMVPVSIEARIPQDPSRYINRLHLVVDKNPVPLAGTFEFGPDGNGWASIETRIRINEYTNVRAIAELNDGSMHMATSFVKAAGGCSIPSAGNLAAAMSRAGKMKLALRRTDRAGLANSAEALVKISHPNNSGMQFDQIKKEFVPAYYVHTIGARLGDKEVFKATTNFSMSENPMIRFRFIPGEEDQNLTVYAIDSDSIEYKHSIDVTGHPK